MILSLQEHYDTLLTVPAMILCWQHQLWCFVDSTSYDTLLTAPIMILCWQHSYDTLLTAPLWYSVDSTVMIFCWQHRYDTLLTAPVMILCWQHQLWYSVDRASRGGDSAQRGRETGVRVQHTQVTPSPAPAASRTHRGTQSPGVMMRRVTILFILQAEFLLSVLWFRALKWWGWCNGYCSGTKSAMSACVCNPEFLCVCFQHQRFVAKCVRFRDMQSNFDETATNEWLFINNNNKTKQKARLVQTYIVLTLNKIKIGFSPC